MEFVGDESKVFSSQVLENVKALAASEKFSADSLELRLDLLKSIAVGAQGSEEVQAALGDESVFAFIARHLQTSDAAPDAQQKIVEAALTAWLRLCRREILQKPTANQQNCDLSAPHLAVLVDSLNQHLASAQIVYLACALIMCLASDSVERQQALGKENAVSATIAAVRAQKVNENALELSLRAARNLANDDDNARAFMEQGIAADLLSILKDAKQQRSENTVEAVFFVLINLSYDNDIALTLGQAGFCQAITDCVPDRIEDGDFCHYFTWALRNITAVNKNLNLLKSTLVCEYLLDLIRKHRNDAETMVSAIWCISNLCNHKDLAERLLDLKVVEALVELYYHGLKTYPEDVKLGPICEAATFSILNMTTTIAPDPITPPQSFDEGDDYRPPTEPEEENIAIKETLSSTGACWLLNEFLIRYSRREAMVEAVCRAIIHLSIRCPANQKQFAQFKIITSLHRAMMENIDLVDTLYLIWRSIFTLTRRDTVDDSEIANDVFLKHIEELQQIPEIGKQIVTTIRKNFSFEEILTNGLTFLVRLGLYSEEKFQELLANGFLKYNEYGDYQVIIKDGPKEISEAFEFDRIASQ